MSTHLLRIDVEPRYLADQSAPDSGDYVFSYTITITNTANTPLQLISRHWVISDASGHQEEVKGLGVVGQQPLLDPGESFRYTSGCRLRAAHGSMHGSYFVVSAGGDRYDVPIPLFVLDAGTPPTHLMGGGPRVLH